MQPKYTNSERYKCLESLKNQSLDLYVVYCGIEECNPGHSFGPTFRNEYLIHYILDGKGTFHADGKTYNVSKYEAFIIYPNEITFYKADNYEPWKYIWIGFNGLKAETCLNYATFSNDNRVCRFNCSDFLLNCVSGILNSNQMTYADDLKRESYLLSFLSAIINEKQMQIANINNYPYQDLIDQGLNYIENNYQKAIIVNDIAAQIGISRSYLTSIFKKRLNISPKIYLLNFRLNKACGLLKTTTLPVNIIASRVGYDDALTFSKIFKRFYKQSPSKYRSSNDTIVKSNEKGSNCLDTPSADK